ncbi:MAG TPA: NUDIX hydrolase [Solirubrobacteraceae bacterium]|nr:NUDIX hydrolase [Solirubrobacteraceae bacterium]
MQAPQPAPGEELNAGPPTVPRQAATVVLLRGGEDGLEVLLVQRNPAARFMGGAWVFPGGAVHADDGDGQAALRAAAVRELREEAGVELSPGHELVAFARWITPAEVRIRFDTWFYLAAAPPTAQPHPDGQEVMDARWYAPRAALEAAARGELLLVFPTIKQLEQLAGFPSASALLRYARNKQVQPVQPRVIGEGETARIVLPGEPGYVP